MMATCFSPKNLPDVTIYENFHAKLSFDHTAQVWPLNRLEAVIEKKCREMSDNRVFLNVGNLSKLDANFSRERVLPCDA